MTKGSAYEDTSTALGGRALATQTLDLAIRVHLVVLEDGHLDLLALVLDLLGGLEEDTSMWEKKKSRTKERTL
jgi:hypothetical protein